MGILDDLLGAAVKSAAGGAAQGGGGLGGALGGALGGMLGNAPAGGSSAGGGLNPAVIMQIVTMLLNKQGGLGGLVNSFNQAGLGDVVKSWISTGQNLPISPSQVTQVLGGGTVGQIASQLGVNAGQAGDLLSKVLPHVVDQLTPQGRVQQGHEAGGDPLTAAIGALAGKLFSQR
jgi:uncharacterized protein YidB (DUF937 family)